MGDGGCLSRHRQWCHGAFSLFVISLLLTSVICRDASARNFTRALPGYKFAFPRDHAAHKDFKIEWWYYDGHLLASDGRRFNYELAFFRRAVDDDATSQTFKVNNLYSAHFAVTDEAGKKFFFREQIDPPGLKEATASETGLSLRNGEFSVQLVGGAHRLKARYLAYSLDLTLTPLKQPVIHGENGVSQKASCEGCASHYYSLTRMKTAGTLTIGVQTMQVNGESWMDHEFGTDILSQEEVGWDWFSVQFDDRTELMLYLLRNSDGTTDPHTAGTYVKSDGSTVRLTIKDFTVKKLGTWSSPASGVTYPMGWQVQIPKLRMDFTVNPVLKNQELITSADTYWEGSADVEGSVRGAPARGRAFVELSGYKDPVDI